MEIIGAGFGRTGTLSMKLALEALGFGPCYHMMEVLENEGHDRAWLDALGGKLPDWDVLLADYRSAVDWPAAHFWRELAAHYPAAKVILTVRDERAWYDSIRQTILAVLTGQQAEDPATLSAHRQMTRLLVLDRVFDGRFDEPDYARAVYREHNDRVREEVSEERLLVYEAGDGWAPLCRFLGVPEPDMPFPHSNSLREFRQKFLAGDS
jgi:hypothetical protein